MSCFCLSTQIYYHLVTIPCLDLTFGNSKRLRPGFQPASNVICFIRIVLSYPHTHSKDIYHKKGLDYFILDTFEIEESQCSLVKGNLKIDASFENTELELSRLLGLAYGSHRPKKKPSTGFQEIFHASPKERTIFLKCTRTWSRTCMKRDMQNDMYSLSCDISNPYKLFAARSSKRTRCSSP